MSTNNNISDLRNHLFESIELLKAGKIDPNQAKAIGNLSKNIIDSAKLELEALKLKPNLPNNGEIPEFVKRKPQLPDSSNYKNMG